MKFVVIGTPREEKSLHLFKEACKDLGLFFEFVQYFSVDPEHVNGDIIYFRDPFNLGDHVFDREWVDVVLNANTNARIVDNIKTPEDLLFEDKFHQFDKIGQYMSPTVKLTEEAYNELNNSKNKYVVKDRLSAGGKGVFFKQNFRFEVDRYLLQERLDIDYDMRVIYIHGRILPIALMRSAKVSDDTTSKSIGVIKLKSSEVMFAEQVIKKIPKFDLVGLDVATTRSGKLYVIEVNRSPQIAIYYRTTGINLAHTLLEKFI